MITAVDTSVLLDILVADATYGARSREALRLCSQEGRIIACDIVWAEVTANFPEGTAAQQALERLRVEFSAPDSAAATTAGRSFKDYRRRGGTRERVIPDFIIGAHAMAVADRLLTRDRGFYRAYFRGLTVFDPSHQGKHPG